MEIATEQEAAKVELEKIQQEEIAKKERKDDQKLEFKRAWQAQQQMKKEAKLVHAKF